MRRQAVEASEQSAAPDMSAELEMAARCAGILERHGLRISFSPGRPGERVAVELRRASGELVRPLVPSEVLELIGMDAGELELWLAETAAGDVEDAQGAQPT